MHVRDWVYNCTDLIASKIAGIVPNMAYVVDAPQPGVTTKACQRGLANLFGRGLGGSWHTPGKFEPLSDWGYEKASYVHGSYEGTNFRSQDTVGISDGGHSFLTVGEYRSKALSVIAPHEELEPLEADHDLRRLMLNPNPVDTFFDIEYELQLFEEVCGVSYEWLPPNRWGRPAERWCIPSHWVWPRTGGGRHYPDGGLAARGGGRLGWGEYAQRDSGQEVGDFARYGNRYLNPFDEKLYQHWDEMIWYYEVRPWGGMGSAGLIRIPPDEIIMTRWKSPINKIDGYSRLAAISQWIDTEESVTKSQWAQMSNVARPEIHIEVPGGYEDPDDQRLKRIEAKFVAKYQGEYNYGRPMITPAGVKVTPLSFNPQQMAYADSGDQLRDRICGTWRIPITAFGIGADMTYGSLLALAASLCENCFNPRLRMKGMTRTKYLASRWDSPDGSRKVRIWYDDCTPTNPEQVNQDIAEDRAHYAITPNEVRALRGRKPYRYGGDDPIVQGPGGVMPFPMNTQEDLSELAELIAPMTQAQEPVKESEKLGQQGGAPGTCKPGQNAARDGCTPAGSTGGSASRSSGDGHGGPSNSLPKEQQQGANASGEPQEAEQPEEAETEGSPGPKNRLRGNLATDLGVKEPNSKPTKGQGSGVSKHLINLARAFLAAKAESNGHTTT